MLTVLKKILNLSSSKCAQSYVQALMLYNNTYRQAQRLKCVTLKIRFIFEQEERRLVSHSVFQNINHTQLKTVNSRVFC